MYRFPVSLLLIISVFFSADLSLKAQNVPVSNIGKNDPALVQLLKDAEIAMKMKPLSVTDNAPIPPSKNKNDFYSWAPYLWPNPATKDGFPYVTKDGHTNPETEAKSDKPLIRRMAVAAQTLSLAYRYTNEKKYAIKAGEFLRTWFLNPSTRMNPNMNFGQCAPGVEKGTSIGIIDSRWLIFVVDAVEYLKGSGALTSAEDAALKTWFKEYLHWLTISDLGKEDGKKNNNHGTWYAAQRAYFAMYAGDQEMAKTIANASRQFFNAQIDTAGRQIFELSRTKSYDYSLYNVHALMTLARVGEKVGVDLWHINPNDKKNIKSSVEYMASFAGDTPKWPYQQIAEKVISLGYEDGDHFSVYYPYDLYSALRIGYKIYKDPAFLKQINELKEKGALKNRANLVIQMD